MTPAFQIVRTALEGPIWRFSLTFRDTTPVCRYFQFRCCPHDPGMKTGNVIGPTFTAPPARSRAPLDQPTNMVPRRLQGKVVSTTVMIVSRAGQRGSSCPGCDGVFLFWTKRQDLSLGSMMFPSPPMYFRVGAGGWGDSRYRSSQMTLGFLQFVEGETHTN
jgi:hypothetical protein